VTPIWTDAKIAALRRLRAGHVPLLRCGEIIGMSYISTLHQAHALGLAQRLNQGRKAGPDTHAPPSPDRSRTVSIDPDRITRGHHT
jgi:hypothetical protein